MFDKMPILGPLTSYTTNGVLIKPAKPTRRKARRSVLRLAGQDVAPMARSKAHLSTLPKFSSGTRVAS
jgi:hypothetical protein